MADIFKRVRSRIAHLSEHDPLRRSTANAENPNNSDQAADGNFAGNVISSLPEGFAVKGGFDLRMSAVERLPENVSDDPPLEIYRPAGPKL